MMNVQNQETHQLHVEQESTYNKSNNLRVSNLLRDKKKLTHITEGRLEGSKNSSSLAISREIEGVSEGSSKKGLSNSKLSEGSSAPKNGEQGFKRLNSVFEWVIILSIMINSIVMALFDYQDRLSLSLWNQTLNKIQLAFTILFTFEAVLRILGMGLVINKNSYLRDPWNWLDFFSVIAGWIEQLPDIPKLKYLRTLRVIRPLRSIKAVPSMRRLIKSLLSSLPMLANVLLFLFFFFLVFAILGVSLFKGDQYYRCRFSREPLSDGSWPIDQSQDRVCNSDGNTIYSCNEGTYCGNPQDYFSDQSKADIQNDEVTFYGYESFDNILQAMLTIFQVITLEGWFQDGHANYLSPIYFIILVVFGGFFLLNLILAVIMDSFAKIDKQQKMQELSAELKKLDIQSKKTVLQQMRTKGGYSKQGTKVFQQKPTKKVVLDAMGIENHDENNNLEFDSVYTEQFFPDEEFDESFESSVSEFDDGDQNKYKINIAQKMKENKDALNQLKKVKSFTNSKSLSLGEDEESKFDENNDNVNKQRSFDQGQAAAIANTRQSFQDSLEKKHETKQENSIATFSQFNESQKFDTKDIEYQEDLNQRVKTHKIYLLFYNICKSSKFQGFILISILANSLQLCLDRYPISQNESDILDAFNTLFFSIFLFEMIIKLIAFGPILYLRDKFNAFDCVIIVLSILDISLKQQTDYNSSVLIAFRAGRLLRIFKIARLWKSLQDLMKRISSTVKDISNFSILLFLFIFTYALLGMELFAQRVKFDDDNNPLDLDNCNDEEIQCISRGKSQRLNFDTWGNAMITIFVLLVGDDWNVVMFDYSRATSKWSVIFFVTLTSFGNLILLNLFLAILLKDFEQQHEKREEYKEKQQLWQQVKDYTTELYRKCLFTCRSKAKKYEIQNVDADNSMKIMEQDENPQFEQSNESLEFSQTSNSKAEESHNATQQLSNPDRKVDSHMSNENNRIPSQNYNEEQGQINSNRPFIIKLHQNQDNSQNLDETNKSLLNDSSKSGTRARRTFLNRGDQASNSISLQKTDKIGLFEHSSLSLNNFIEKSPTSLKSKANDLFDLKKKSPVKNLDDVLTNSQNGRLSMVPHDHQIALFSKTLTDRKLKTQLTLEGRSLYLLSKNNVIRNLISRLVRHSQFDNITSLLIVASTILLALDQPLSDPDSNFNQNLMIFDGTFTSLFMLECILKIVAFGLILNGKNSYLQSPWNILDLIITLLSFVSMIQLNELKIVKSLRVFRILRPLRMISQNEELKIAVLCLGNSIKDIFNVFVIAIFSFTVYAIFGVNFFKGQFYYCFIDHLPENFQEKLDRTNSYTKWHCISMGGEWKVDRSNFDNVFYGVLTLFQMATTENWVAVMWNGIDSTDTDYTYEIYKNPSASIYFIFFILIGSLFIMNLFVGVVINTFKFEKEKLGLNYILTDTQKEWIKVQIKCYKYKPVPRDQPINNRFRKIIAKLTKSQKFEMFIYFIITVNIIVFACNWYMQPQQVEDDFEFVNHAFTVIFTIEAIFKLITFGKNYFKDGWNIFDLIILMGTYIQIFLTNVFDKNLGAHATFLRIFRLGRVLRLVKKAQSLRNIFITLIVTLPSLANIGFLLFLLIYLYSLLGMNLFGEVRIHGELNDHANFQNFLNSFLTLLRCATGENWNELMKSLMDKNSIEYNCIENPTYDDYLKNDKVPVGCGDYWSSVIYFISYQLLVTFVFLNLFIAIILEGFRDTTEDQNLRVDDIMITKFKNIWQTFDQDGTGFIEVQQIGDFISDLIVKNTDFIRGGEFLLNNPREMDKFIAELQLPTYNKFKNYHFYDILIHLVKIIFKIDFDKAALLKSEGLMISKSNTMHSGGNNSLGINNYLQNQDQLEFDSFEHLISNFYEIVKNKKIQLYEEYKKYRWVEDRKKNRFKDKYDNHYYDSRVIIYFPVLLKKLQNFTNLMKQKRLLQGEEQAKIQAQQEIQQIKLLSSPQRIFDKTKRNSVFIAMAQNAKVFEQLIAQKSSLKEQDTQNTLSPFRNQQSSIKNTLSNRRSTLLENLNINLNQQNSENLISDITSQDSFIKKQFSNRNSIAENNEDSQKTLGSNLGPSDYKKNQTEIMKKLSILKNIQADDIHRGSTTLSNQQRPSHFMNNNMIIEEDQESQGESPGQEKEKSFNYDQDVSSITSNSEKNIESSYRSKINNQKDIQIMSIKQLSHQSSSSPSNSPLSNNVKDFMPRTILSTNSAKRLTIDNNRKKLQPDEIIDEEKSYEETATNRNKNISSVGKQDFEYRHDIDGDTNKEINQQVDDDLKRNNTISVTKKKQSSFNLKEIGLQLTKTMNPRMSTFASNKGKSSEEIMEEDFQDSNQKRSKIIVEDKIDEDDQELFEDEYIEIEQYLKSSTISMPSQKNQVILNVIHSNTKEESKNYDTEYNNLEKSNKHQRENLSRDNQLSKFSQIKFKQSELTFGHLSNNKLGDIIETQHENKKSKKISSKTTHFQFYSQLDLLSEQKRSSNKNSSNRYQNVFVDKDDFQDDLDDSPQQYLKDLESFNDSLEAQRNNQKQSFKAITQPLIMKQMLEIDSNSSIDSSDEEEYKTQQNLEQSNGQGFQRSFNYSTMLNDKENSYLAQNSGERVIQYQQQNQIQDIQLQSIESPKRSRVQGKQEEVKPSHLQIDTFQDEDYEKEDNSDEEMQRINLQKTSNIQRANTSELYQQIMGEMKNEEITVQNIQQQEEQEFEVQSAIKTDDSEDEFGNNNFIFDEDKNQGAKNELINTQKIPEVQNQKIERFWVKVAHQNSQDQFLSIDSSLN
ncbi:voltage-gated ion channel superfamily [Stylonychia lemnae]|uniref:Voltage-gated ion channel superfamily n=1 Tax=Stylonychia lemnae TaxID=5949 RepID=A0A078ANT9_STYLE|nr:voltage-gated ion channel superfamily [Stylonychia lemnae]|eukprot:CDW82972.1 voltage-gated ion channel superfamily [Stylonychia lemnae]